MVTEDDLDRPPLTDEEVEDLEEFYALCGRYPTFLIVHKIASRHARLKRLRKLRAPDMVIEKDEQMLEGALDSLCESLLFDATTNLYPFKEVIEHFRDELEHPPDDVADDEPDA